MNRRSALAFVAIGLLWGSAWIPTSEVLKEVPPLYAGALRFAIAAVFTAFLTLWQRLRGGKTRSRIDRALVRNAVVLSMTALALPYAFIVWASAHIASAIVPFLFAFMPLVVLVIGGDLPNRLLPSLITGSSGVVLLIAQGLSFSLSQLGGILLLLCAVVLGAFSLIYAKKHLGISDLLLSSSIQLAIAALLLAAINLVTERAHPPIPNTAAILWLLTLGILISGITLPLLYWLLTEVEAWHAALLQWISTLVAVAEAALFLRFRPSFEELVGAVCIIGATLWLLRNSEAAPREIEVLLP